MVSKKYRGSCIGAVLAKWLAKNTVASQKMALEEKMEDGALEMLLELSFSAIIQFPLKILYSYLYFEKKNILKTVWS